MSIALERNADEKVIENVYKRVVQSSYKSVQDDVANCYAIKFVDDMQKLVVKVACIVSEVAVSVKFKEGYYQAALNYLCKRVLQDNDLYNDFKAVKINENANTNKHSIDEVSANESTIDRGVKQYNRLVNRLVSSLSIPSLGKLLITAQKGSAQKPKKPVFGQISEPTRAMQNLQRTVKRSQELAATSAKQAPQKKAVAPKTDKSKFVLNDPAGSLTVELLHGDGWITKHKVFGADEKVLHCVLKVSYGGANQLKSVVAYIGKAKQKVILRLGENELELSKSDCDFPEVKITVEATVKLGLMKTKPLKCTVSRNF